MSSTIREGLNQIPEILQFKISSAPAEVNDFGLITLSSLIHEAVFDNYNRK